MRMKLWRGGCLRTVLVLLLACLIALPLLMSAPARAIDLGRTCSVSVSAGGAELAEELARADVVIDLYRVAGAMEVPGFDAYSYQLLAPYTELVMPDEMDNGAWQTMSQQAAAIALDRGVPIVTGAATDTPIGETDEGVPLAAGLYLIVARGADMEREDYIIEAQDEDGNAYLATAARSSELEFIYAPQLISLPTKDAEDGVISTANAGDWIYDAAVAMKPERGIRFGSLEIVKTVESFGGAGRATFVFDITAELDGEIVYSNVAALHFAGAGTAGTVIDQLPVGATVTVTEIYSGGRFSPVGAAVQTAVIEAQETSTVRFTNAYNDSVLEGSGIQNHFFVTESGGWDVAQQITNE